MKLRPFKELIAMSKEKIDEVMAAPRARRVKAQAEVKRSELECEILTLETQAQEIWLNKDVYFDTYFDLLDRIGLLERRRDQYEEALGQLFPEDVTPKPETE